MHPGTRHLPNGIEPCHVRLPAHGGRDSAAIVVGSGADRNGFGDGVYSAARNQLIDGGEHFFPFLSPETGGIQVEVIQTVSHHIFLFCRRNHVTRRQVLLGMNPAHDPVALPVHQESAFPAHRFGHEYPPVALNFNGRYKNGGVELHEFEVAADGSGAQGCGQTDSVDDFGVCGRVPQLADSAGCEDDRKSGNDPESAPGISHRGATGAAFSIDQDIAQLAVFQDFQFTLSAGVPGRAVHGGDIFCQRNLDFMSRSVPVGVQDAPRGMPPFQVQVDFPGRVAVEARSDTHHPLQGSRGFLNQGAHRRLAA